MARRYDQSTTTFSPEGNLYQVENACEAINNAGTCIGIQSPEGVVLAAEIRVVSKLLAPSKQSEKTFVIDKHCITLIAGFTSDANILVENARVDAQRYLLKYRNFMPIEQIIRGACDYKHSYTQHGGLRPFGVGFLMAGWDKNHGFQLYQSDPAGNFTGWKATVIGQNNHAGKSILKTDLKEAATLDENIRLSIKILMKTMDSTTPSADRIEISTVTRDAATGEIFHRFVPKEAIEAILKELQAAADAEQTRETASAADM